MICLCRLNLSKKYKIDIKAISMGQGQEHSRKIPLWITTDVSSKFPITFLQMAIKFTNEPPQGVKAGLKRTYAWFTQDMLDMSTRPQYKPLLYGLAFLHSVVQERRKFGPLGWNIPYDFHSWQTARYMFCEVHYGGRVTDDFDRRLLNTYGKVWFGDHMFLDNFSFYKGYVIPHLKTVEEYRLSIESLPLVDTPDVFGLHPNADISSQTKDSQRMLDTIMSIQPKDMISIVRSTLSDLKLAIDGTIIVSAQLQEALDALYDARVPIAWVKVSWQSATLGLWYSELLSRIAQFHTWLYDGSRWSSGFLDSLTSGFLTAIRQKLPLAPEVMKQMKEDITAPPSEGNIRLTESQPKVIHQAMPVVHVSATNSTDDGDPRIRTDQNYIFDIDLKTTANPDYWVLRGIALLCATS
ncbi:dynein heavy chain and region D6 of dynein motor-domain-containing protein [Chytridium lagenaria]|nr:dynein heavy chain and region D6 of dynein motor-domain-containing protein [Chytridium lagenaria]